MAIGARDLANFATYEAALTHTLGPVVGGNALSKALGYRTQAAFRKAKQRGRLPIKTFEVEGRRGRFAATSDIAAWLWAKRAACPTPTTAEEPAAGHH